MLHKCRVFKQDYDECPWWIECSISDCWHRKAYIKNKTWEQAMLGALHHRIFHD